MQVRSVLSNERSTEVPGDEKVPASPTKQAPDVLASPAKLAQSVPPLTEVGTQGVPPLNEVGTDGRHVLDIGRGEQAAKPLLRTGPKWVPALRRLCHLPPNVTSLLYPMSKKLCGEHIGPSWHAQPGWRNHFT